MMTFMFLAGGTVANATEGGAVGGQRIADPIKMVLPHIKVT